MPPPLIRPLSSFPVFRSRRDLPWHFFPRTHVARVSAFSHSERFGRCDRVALGIPAEADAVVTGIAVGRHSPDPQAAVELVFSDGRVEQVVASVALDFFRHLACEGGKVEVERVRFPPGGLLWVRHTSVFPVYEVYLSFLVQEFRKPEPVPTPTPSPEVKP